ncbi:MAG: hypothetical protein IPJ98_30680 [Bryobacterales bacterium]|nr:hypothetical protein [Bryobacterales bacterium]
MAGAVGLAVILQRDGGADPDTGHRLHLAALVEAGAVEGEVEALRRGGAHFEDEELVGRPIGGEARVEVAQSPAVFGFGAVEVRGDGRGGGGQGESQQERCRCGQ